MPKNNNDNPQKLHVARPIGMQHATNSPQNATPKQNKDATTDWDALADKVLGCNEQCNGNATNIKKPCNFSVPKVASKSACKSCKSNEEIEGIGRGCVHIAKGHYQRQWTALDKLPDCPRGFWN